MYFYIILYRRHTELTVKCNVGLTALIQQYISEQVFFGGLVYKFKRIVGKPPLPCQIKTIIKRSKCIVVNPFTVYISLHDCDGSGPDGIKLFSYSAEHEIHPAH